MSRQPIAPETGAPPRGYDTMYTPRDPQAQAVLNFNESDDDDDHLEATFNHRVVFAYLMMLALVAAFVVQLWQAGWSFVPISQNPFFGTSATDMIRCGAEVGSCIVSQHQWWRLFSSQIMHGGCIHLASNLWVLYSIGGDLERTFGAVRVAALYLLSGLFGALATAIFLPTVVAVGASGAICGLFGAYWSDFISNCGFFRGQQCRVFFSLAFNTIMLIVISLLPYVNFFAHGGGFVCGLLGGFALMIRRRPITIAGKTYSNVSCRQHFLAGVGALVLLVGFVAQLVCLYYVIDPYQYCEWCKYAECFPTPLWDCDKPMCSYSYEQGSNCVTELICMAGQAVTPGNGTCTDASDAAAVSGLCKSLCPQYCGSAFF